MINNNKLGFIFCHGWGFDEKFWDNILPFFKGYKTILLDLGYFQNKSNYDNLIIENNNIKWIGIGHSIGFIKLLSLPIPFKSIVSICGFTHFSEHTINDGDVAKKILEKMEEDLLKIPKTLLKKFYKNCGLPNFPIPTHIKYNVLLKDLNLLKNNDFDYTITQKLEILALVAQNDKIVPKGLTNKCFNKMGKLSKAKIIEIKGSEHALGYLYPKQCSDIIFSFINEHFHNE